MEELKLYASPGHAIVELLKEKTSIITGEQKDRIKRGKIIAMGIDQTTDYGTKIPASEYGKVGDIIYFLHYFESEGLDHTFTNGKTIFFVKWIDFKGGEK